MSWAVFLASENRLIMTLYREIIHSRRAYHGMAIFLIRNDVAAGITPTNQMLAGWLFYVSLI